MNAAEPVGAGPRGVKAAALAVREAEGSDPAETPLAIEVAPGERVLVLAGDPARVAGLVALVAGAHRPVGARTHLFGEDISSLAAHERIRLGLRVIRTEPSLFDDLTVAEHVMLVHRTTVHSLARRGDPPDAAATERVRALLDAVGLGADAEREASALPASAARRLEVAMAMAGAPRVILAALCFTGLPTVEAGALRQALEAIPAHVTLLLVTDVPPADPIVFDRVIELDHPATSADAAVTPAGGPGAPEAPLSGPVLRVVRPSLDDAPSREPGAAGAPRQEERPPRSTPAPARRMDPYDRVAYVAGTFDTKAGELGYIERCLERAGLRVTTVDLSTSGRPSVADVGPREVALNHPKGAHAVFTGDRGESVSAMAEAFAAFLPGRRDLGGVISAGGSGGTALATPAMQRLDVGVPKVMVSTVASGDVSSYVGPSDICMMYSVTDVQGINRISERVLENAANALAGMIAQRTEASATTGKPAIGVTMFGVTTPCVQQIVAALETDYDCLVFHATGTGGQSMEKLVDSGMLGAVIDTTTTEIADLLVGGVMSAGEDRLGAIARTGVPYVGSCGALDMVNFGAIDTVPEQFRSRNLYQHNAQVTLMRTTPEENAVFGRFIADKLNHCDGPVRFLLPEGGVSLIDAPGMPFHDPEADRALFDAIEQTLVQTDRRRIVKLTCNINDPEFARAAVECFHEIARPAEPAHPEHRDARIRT